MLQEVTWSFYKTNTPRKRTGKTEINLTSKWGCVEFEAPVALYIGRGPSCVYWKGLVGSEAPSGYSGGEEIMFVPSLK